MVEQLGGLEAIGGSKMDNMYHAGWAWAGNSPFRYTKLAAADWGGTRTPMVISWPARIEPGSTPRPHFPGGIAIDPQGPFFKGWQGHVTRGGWYSVDDFSCRLDSRQMMAFPDDWPAIFGFRVVLAPVVFRPQPNMVWIPPGSFMMGSPETAYLGRGDAVQR